METATAQQKNGLVENVTKRGRGRPHVVENLQKGYIRGARKGTIAEFQGLIKELGGNVGDELEKLLRSAIDALRSPEQRKARAEQLRAEKLREIEALDQEIWSASAEIQHQHQYQNDSPEVVAAVEVQADLVCSDVELKARFEEFVGQDAQRIAQRFPGVQWEAVKQALRRAVDLKFEKRLRRRQGNAGMT